MLFYYNEDDFPSDDPLDYHPPPWMSLSVKLIVLSDKNVVVFVEFCKQVEWIHNIPDDPSDSLLTLIEQPDSDSDTSDPLPQVFVSEGGNAAGQSDKYDEIIYLSILQRKYRVSSTEISLFTFAAIDDDSVVDACGLEQPHPKTLHQSNQIRIVNLASWKNTKIYLYLWIQQSFKFYCQTLMQEI